MGVVSFSENVKTRKDHKCFGCNRNIPAGTIINDIVSAECGDIYHVRLCNVCEVIAEDYQRQGDDWYQGDLKEEPYWTEWKNKIEEGQKAQQPTGANRH